MAYPWRITEGCDYYRDEDISLRFLLLALYCQMPSWDSYHLSTNHRIESLVFAGVYAHPEASMLSMSYWDHHHNSNSRAISQSMDC